MWAQLRNTSMSMGMVTSVAFWPGSKHWLVRQACFQVRSYMEKVFLENRKEAFFVERWKALISGRFPTEIGWSQWRCSDGDYFSIKQLLTCWCVSTCGNYIVLKKRSKYFHVFLKSCGWNSCTCSLIPCFSHISPEMFNRKGKVTRN